MNESGGMQKSAEEAIWTKNEDGGDSLEQEDTMRCSVEGDMKAATGDGVEGDKSVFQFVSPCAIGVMGPTLCG